MCHMLKNARTHVRRETEFFAFVCDFCCGVLVAVAVSVLALSSAKVYAPRSIH